MSTIRIYKVAEVLGLPSQEVIDLLKEQHGIDVKSASSTVEEIVARQFVDRVSRDRKIDLPRGHGSAMFSGTTPRPAAKRGRQAAQAQEEPPQPKLGPPRLIKSAKAARVADEDAEGRPADEDGGHGERAEPAAEAAIVASVPDQAAASPSPPPAAEVTSPPPAPVEPVERPAPRMRGLRIENEPPRMRPPSIRTIEPRPAVPSAPAAATVAATPARDQPTTQTEKVPVSVTPPPVVAPPVAPSVTLPVVAPPPVDTLPQVSKAPAATQPRPAAPPAPVAAQAQAPPGTQVPAAPQAPAESRVAAPPPPGRQPPVRQPPMSSAIAKPTGRIAPPTLRLRVEESRPRPKRAVITRTIPIARPAARGAATPRPVTTRPPLGGPRPLPSQPVRPGAPRPLPARPAVGYRPPPRPYRSPGRRSERRTKIQAPIVPKPPPPITRTITLAEGMTVKDLADRLEVRAKDVLKKLIERRMMLTINTTLDAETATMIAREFGADVKMRSFEEEMVHVEAEDTKAEDLVPRAPVVTVMGHVDHGKTSLLDVIRKSRVAEREAGGITQHIGAYSVEVKNRRVVFLDTPGHAAFTTMRARGAGVTDIVVLVVAADDGVMPQTKEAIDHARAAKVPIVVAINKIDKSNANPDRVKQELAEIGLTPEEWGGETVMVLVSAKKEENLDGLLEMILLVTELGEHKANPKRVATGTVLEAKVDRGRGPVATILVQDGTLNVGDNFIAGTVVGRVRALIDDRGAQVKSVGPSNPVEVLGLTGIPQPGDAFQAVDDAAKARQIALLRSASAKEKVLGDRSSRITLESLQQQLAEGGTKELPIIIKADVQGSAEVLAQTLAKLGDERVKIRIIHTGVGAISESDVLLASTSNAIIIGFNVRPDRNAASIAEAEGVDIRKHAVIYHVTDEIKQAMAGLLEPTLREQQLGAATVRETFKVPKFGTAAGCMVTEGQITRSGEVKVRLVRDGVVVHEGRIGSLRRFKDDVNEVKTGFEFGMAFERFSDIKIGDVIESYTVEKVAATVS